MYYYGLFLIAMNGILAILGVVLGIIGMDRGWGYKAWIPLGIFSLIITVLIVLAVYNGIWGAMRDAIVWLMIVIAELLGVVLGIIGINRGWGRKAWIPLGVALPTVMGSGIIILIITCCTT